jgi:uncharacterized protein YkwD
MYNFVKIRSKKNENIRCMKILFVLLVLVSVYSCKAQNFRYEPAQDESVSPDNMAWNILKYVNEYRNSLGLPALKMLRYASQLAARHSNDMAQKKVGFGHTGFDKRVNAIARSLGQNAVAGAENVAYGYLDAKAVVNGWINSPPHRKNMQGNYNLTGIGIAQAKDGTVFFTEIFIRN